TVVVRAAVIVCAAVAVLVAVRVVRVTGRGVVRCSGGDGHRLDGGLALPRDGLGHELVVVPAVVDDEIGVGDPGRLDGGDLEGVRVGGGIGDQRGDIGIGPGDRGGDIAPDVRRGDHADPAGVGFA